MPRNKEEGTERKELKKRQEDRETKDQRGTNISHLVTWELSVDAVADHTWVRGLPVTEQCSHRWPTLN
jgi:hypothetical protein